MEFKEHIGMGLLCTTVGVVQLQPQPVFGKRHSICQPPLTLFGKLNARNLRSLQRPLRGNVLNEQFELCIVLNVQERLNR